MLATGAYGVPEEKVASVAVTAVVLFCSKFATPSLKHIHLVDIRPGIVRLYQKELEVQVTRTGVFVHDRFNVWKSWLSNQSATASPLRHQTGGDKFGTDVDQTPTRSAAQRHTWHDSRNGSYGRGTSNPSERAQKDHQEQKDREMALWLQESENNRMKTMSADRGCGIGLKKLAAPLVPGKMNDAEAVVGDASRPGITSAPHGQPGDASGL